MFFIHILPRKKYLYSTIHLKFTNLILVILTIFWLTDLYELYWIFEYFSIWIPQSQKASWWTICCPSNKQTCRTPSSTPTIELCWRSPSIGLKFLCCTQRPCRSRVHFCKDWPRGIYRFIIQIHSSLDSTNPDVMKYHQHIVNKCQLPFNYFSIVNSVLFSELLDLVNKSGLTGLIL